MSVVVSNKPHHKRNRLISFLALSRRWLRFLLNPNRGQVYFHKNDLYNLPELPNISPMYIKEMATDNECEIDVWLQIIGQSFSRSLKHADYKKAIVDHNEYLVTHTYLLMQGKEYIGVVSEGVFRKDEKIGVTHYLGLKRSYLGRGLGKYLILYALHRMRDKGIEFCEGESNLEHVKSLCIHFDFGFRPKNRDYWNVENVTPWPFNIITYRRFCALYSNWQKKLL